MTSRLLSTVFYVTFIVVSIDNAVIFAWQPHPLTDEMCAFTLRATASQEGIDVISQLEVLSDLRLSGNEPISLDTLVFFVSQELSPGWNIPTTVDRPALVKRGIHSAEIALGSLQTGGISRRSSLRFVLDTFGLSYYLNDSQLVVTTKEIARVKWLNQLAKPNIKMLRAEGERERRQVAFAAGFWHLNSSEWVGPLMTALNDSDREVSFDAAFALGECGPEASNAIEALLQLLRSKDLALREAATCALGKIGPESSMRLIEMIEDPDPGVGLAAVKAFGAMGSAGNDSVLDLIAAGKRFANRKESRGEDRCEFCYAIGSALADVELGKAVPQLRELLKSEGAGVRSFAAYAIGEIGSPGQVCEPELQKLLTDVNTAVRRDAAYALAQINLPSDTSTTALEAAAKDSDRLVRLWAAAALRVIRSKK